MIYETGKFAALAAEISMHVLHVTKEESVGFTEGNVIAVEQAVLQGRAERSSYGECKSLTTQIFTLLVIAVNENKGTFLCIHQSIGNAIWE